MDAIDDQKASTYKLIVLFNVKDWLTGTFIDAAGSNLFFGQPWP